MRRRSLAVLALIAAALLPASPAKAATITVTTMADEHSNPGPETGCSLREAIRAANVDAPFGGCPAGSGADTVVLPPGPYDLTLGGVGDNTTAAGDLDILSSLTIEGADPATTIISALTLGDLVFHIPPSAGAVTVEVSGVTIRDGNAGSGNGGGILIQGGTATVNIVNSIVRNNTAIRGGGIDNGAAVLNLTDTALIENGSVVDGGGLRQGGASRLNLTRVLIAENTTDGAGGGIFDQSDVSPGGVTIDDSAFVGNIANDDGMVDGNGGGLFVDDLPVTVTDTTFTGNRSVNGDALWLGEGGTLTNLTISGNGSTASGGQGGGLYSQVGTSTLNNVTFDGNVADGAVAGSGGNIYAIGTVQARNTVMGDDLGGGSCGGTAPTSLGSNLEEGGGGTPCGFTSVPDVGLETLADNGGPQLPGGQGAPPTQALRSGSPALDAGTGCAAADQRGVPRPQSSACDIGAYERGLCQGILVNRVGVDTGNGVITGTEQPDGILGLGGDESIEALGGGDAVCAGGGRDRINGGPGRDRLRGDAGNDSVQGGAQNDRLKGGPGKDTLKGQQGKDRLAGQGGKDRCVGGPGKDKANRSCEKAPGVP